MLKKFIHEYGSSWDELLPYLLFAIRTAKNEGTGYSPDELVFGRQLRTGLAVQRDSWENNDNAEETLKISAVDFVSELQQRVKTALEAASVNALSAHEKAKQYYDRRCKNRELTENDLVLILEPTSGNKLLATWTGPAKVEKRLENNYYLVKLGRRTLKRHINSLRKYYTDKTATSSCGTVNVVIGLYESDSDKVKDGEFGHRPPCGLGGGDNVIKTAGAALRR